MTIPPTFPSLPVGWSVHKKPTFRTLVADAASGREIRASLYQYPLWEFELTFEGLAADSSFPGLGAQSLQSLMGFFLQCQGQFGPFLYIDPSDNSATLQPVGSGDGATLSFIMPRTLGGFAEPVGWVTSIANVYVNGVNQASGWSLTTPNALVFATAPGVGAAITATFSYAFVCRFLEDVQDFEEFMQNLWALESLKFRSLRTA
jgi:hypothetical protein